MRTVEARGVVVGTLKAVPCSREQADEEIEYFAECIEEYCMAFSGGRCMRMP